MTLHYKPCTCSCCQGTMWYSEVENFQAGGDPEWSYSSYWSCDTCGEYVSSYDEKFEYLEDW